LVTTWDDEQEAKEFNRLFRQYGTLRFGSPASENEGAITWQTEVAASLFTWNGAQTTWILAPNAGTVQKIAETIKGQ
jgi:hypothetical protein